MNDEEKKAVEFIRDLIAWDVRQDLCPNKEECKNLEIILNLIEKLQKQIEELNIRLQEEINEKCKLKTELYLNSIPKSKIEEKVEKLQKANFNDYTKEQDGNEVKMKILYEFKKVLESE